MTTLLEERINKWFFENESDMTVEINTEESFRLNIYDNILDVNVDIEKKEYKIGTESSSIAFQSICGSMIEFTQLKNPSIKGFLNKLNKMINKKKDKLNNENKVYIEEKPTNENISESLFDKHEYKLTKLKEQLELNASKFYKDTEKDENENIKIFDKDNIINILISLFIETCDNFKNNSNIEIELEDEYNIFNWVIKFKKFENKKLNNDLDIINKNFGFDNITMNLKFHQDFYPLYPIEINIIRPRLKKLLIHRIANLKMVQQSCWTPERSPTFIINKIYKILNNKAEIDVLNNLNNNEDGAFYPLEKELIKLASLCNDLSINYDDLDDETYEKVNIKESISKEEHVINRRGNKTWARGTGFGFNGLKKWDIEKYNKLQQERDNKIVKTLNNLKSKIKEYIEDNKIDELKESLEGSYINPFIKSNLNGTTFLHINKHVDVYNNIFDLIELLCNKDTFYMLNDDESSTSIVDMMFELKEQCDDILSMNIKKEINEMKIVNIVNKLCDKLNEYVENNSYKIKKEQTTNVEDKKETLIGGINVPNEIKKKYLDEMKDEQFDLAYILNDDVWGYVYRNNYNIDKKKTLKPKHLMRVGQELSALKKSSPISFESSIFVRKDEQHPTVIRVCITGTDGTPYDSGCFFFDIYIHGDYPNKPPLCWFLNTGGNRHNPNLYNSGKVCLSLLGTWGTNDSSESWDPKVSTLSQILISIQSLILVAEPFFNEPGEEQNMFSKTQQKRSKDYNHIRRIYTMNNCMSDIIEKPINDFEDMIKKHFTIKKDYIKNITKKWVDEAYGTKYQEDTLNAYNRLLKNLDDIN